MYGIAGYATNAYASELQTGNLVAPIITLTPLVLQLRFRIIQPQRVTQSDYGYELPFTLEDGNGNPVNLSGASLLLNVQDSQDAADALLLSGSMIVDSASSGTCHYTVAQGNFPNPGTFLAQITATWTGSVQLTWSGIKIIVEPQLPKTNN